MNSERRSSRRSSKVFQTSVGERGDRGGILVGAIDDAEASEFRRHLLGEFFDDIEIDAEPLRSVDCGEDDRGRSHQAAIAVVRGAQFHGSS